MSSRTKEDIDTQNYHIRIIWFTSVTIFVIYTIVMIIITKNKRQTHKNLNEVVISSSRNITNSNNSNENDRYSDNRVNSNPSKQQQEPLLS